MNLPDFDPRVIVGLSRPCQKCAHCKHTPGTPLELTATCQHPKRLTPNFVTGEAVAPLCSVERGYYVASDACGQSGKNFEPRHDFAVDNSAAQQPGRFQLSDQTYDA